MKTSGKKSEVLFAIQNKKELNALYRLIHDYLVSLGPVQALPHKTQVSFGGKNFKTNFAFVWLPHSLNKKFPENALMLTIDLPRHVTSPKIHDVVHLRSVRWAHHILLEKKEDVDGEVKKLLKESFAFGKIGLRAVTLTQKEPVSRD